MRVAVNVEQLLHDAPGGIGRYTAELVRLLPAHGVDVTAFTARHPRARVADALAAYGLANVEPVVLGLPVPLLYDAWHLLGVPSPVRRVAPVDLVHAPSAAVPPTGRVPLVVTLHDAAPVIMPEAFTRRGVWFHRQGYRAARRRARRVIAVSQAAADEIVAHTRIPPDRIRVVPNGVDLAPAAPVEVDAARRRYHLDDRPYVLWIGSLQPRKNVRVLLDAFARLDPGAVPHRLVLVGAPGWRMAHGALAHDLGERVVSLSRVPDAELAALYAGADLYACPSLHEGFGLPVLEAMAQRTAVVCADIPALREVAGDTARFVDPRSVDGWADALGELLTDAASRAALADRGRSRAEGYSWDRCVAATVVVYREALG